MCGIVGIAKFDKFGLLKHDMDMFLELLIADQVRGSDGTGIFAVTLDGICQTVKMGGNVTDLMRSKGFNQRWEHWLKNGVRILVGHNRFATTGKTNTACAHPFISNHIVMVHNGTLSQASDLKLDNFEVDSEALASEISKVGVEEALKKTSGAYTIVYYDSKEKTLNFIRNGERPLAIFEDQKMNRLVFASESKMLEWIADRNFINIGTPDDLPIDTLVSFPLLSMKKEEKENVNGKKPITTVQYGTHGMETYGIYDKDDEDFPTKEKQVTELEQYKQEKLKKFRLRKKNYLIAKEFHKFKAQDNITFRIVDYIEENADLEKFIVEGRHDEIPEVQILMHLKGGTNVDTLFEAGYCEATIKNIMLDAGSKKDAKHIMWVADPKVVWPQ